MHYRFCKILSYAFSLVFLSLGACKSEEKLPDLGTNLSGSVSIQTSPSGNYFYVLNSDYERRFNEGSVLIIDPGAEAGKQKVRAFPTRRMGRSMQIAQNMMILTFVDSENQKLGHVEIWSLADETNPTLLVSHSIACEPVAGIIAPSTPYYAVSCYDGSLFVGKGPTNTAENPATLDFVRGYGFEHRALYFFEDGGKTWLLGFPSDTGVPDSGDGVFIDKKQYVLGTEDEMVDGPNGTPDDFEATTSARRRLDFAVPFQMFIYPVSDEEAASANVRNDPPTFSTFRSALLGPVSRPTLANQELRYVYFNLNDRLGLPAGSEGTLEPFNRAYRSNFWVAKPGIEGDPKTFYLSQRGTNYGSSSNNVFRLNIDVAALIRPDALFDEIFKVERVYGFRIDRDNDGRYPGTFDLVVSGGEPMLFVNHFRDLIDFAAAPFYSVSRKFLNGPQAEFEPASSIDSTDFNISYYDVAVSGTKGKFLTTSFYGKTLYLFDVDPSISLKGQTPTVIE